MVQEFPGHTYSGFQVGPPIHIRGQQVLGSLKVDLSLLNVSIEGRGASIGNETFTTGDQNVGNI